MDTSESELRQRLAEVDERIDRIGKRFTAGYGSDTDRDGWLAWLRELEARRAGLLRELEAHGARREEPPTRPTSAGDEGPGQG